MKALHEIRVLLGDRRLMLVAEATGLHYNTIRDIRDGRRKNPTIETVQKLSDYLGGAENG